MCVPPVQHFLLQPLCVKGGPCTILQHVHVWLLWITWGEGCLQFSSSFCSLVQPKLCPCRNSSSVVSFISFHPEHAPILTCSLCNSTWETKRTTSESDCGCRQKWTCSWNYSSCFLSTSPFSLLSWKRTKAHQFLLLLPCLLPTQSMQNAGHWQSTVWLSPGVPLLRYWFCFNLLSE